MVFYAFFTGAASMQSILLEEERGTLPRLFTTPTPIPQILAGKFLASFLMLIVQVTVLILFGRLVFDIRWGDPLPVLFAGAALVIVSVTMGLFLVSFLESSRQAGVVFGGVLTLTGMLGLITIFTAGAPNTPQLVRTASLLVPQGWAVRGIQEAMGGSDLGSVAGTVAITLAWSVVFAIIGQRRLSRRFA
jgi:ABC-2 type transport system permease protein